MSTNELTNLDENDDYQLRRSSSEQNGFDDHTPPFILEDDDDGDEETDQVPPEIKPRRQSQIPKFKQSKRLSKSMIITPDKPSPKKRQ